MAFYDHAASSFDDAYELSPSNNLDDLRYNRERAFIERAVKHFGQGRILDIGAGTGYWLRHYLGNVRDAVLLEPSDRMRALAGQRVTDYGLQACVHLVAGTHECVRERSVRSVLVSQVLGHYDRSGQEAILRAAVNSLQSGGEILLIDSMWNPRVEAIYRQRVGIMARMIEGSSRTLYKHYFLRSEVTELIHSVGLRNINVCFGRSFWLARGPL